MAGPNSLARPKDTPGLDFCTGPFPQFGENKADLVFTSL